MIKKHANKHSNNATKNFNITKAFIIFLSAIMIFSSFASYICTDLSFADELDNFTLQPSDIKAECAILMDKESGQILFQKNMDKQMYPASITKIMTAILVLEDLNLDEIVEIDAKTPFSDGNRIWVKEGEKFSVKDLLHAMLIGSANDAAVALAKAHSGTVEEFAKKMNEKAVKLGAKNTHFTNPNGLPDENHVTTAYDMAKIAQHAANMPQLLEIVGTISYEIPPTELTNESRNIHTTNKFLYGTGKDCKMNYKGDRIDIKYEPILGLKTGYTSEAKHTYVGYAKKNEMELISVILKSDKEHFYSDTRTLMDYGFDNFKKINLVNKGETLETLNLNDGKKTQIPAVAKKSLNVYVPKQTIDGSWTENIEIIPDLKLPLPADGKLGTVSYTIGNKTLASTDLVTLNFVSDKAMLDDKVTPLNVDNKGKWSILYEYSLWIKIVVTFLIWRTIMTIIRLIRDKKMAQSKR